MRTVLLSILLAGCTSSEHSIYGIYETNYDSVAISDSGGYSSAGVVEVTATDQWGEFLDDAFFRNESIEGPFTVQVPDGSVAVHLKFKQFTSDGANPTIYAIADGPVNGDIDAGLIVISQ